MSVFDSVPTTPVVLRADLPLDEAQLAAVAFLARYRAAPRSPTRADLRQFFQWASDLGLPPLAATRAHIELYRSSIEARPGRVDGRSAAVDGVRLLPVRPHRRPHRFEPAQPARHRAAVGPHRSHRRPGERGAERRPILQRSDGARLDTRTAYRWVRAIGKRAEIGHVHPHMLARRSSWPPSTPASRCVTSNSPPVTPTRGPPPGTTGDARTSTVTPPTPSSPSSPADDHAGSSDRRRCHRTPPSWCFGLRA